MNEELKTKKWLSTILVCALAASLFSVSGCSFFGSSDNSNDPAVEESRKDASRAARDVMEAIDALGAISLQSEEAVASVEALYDALSEEEKAEVANYDVLTAARQALDQLKLQGFAADYLNQVKPAFLYPESVVVNHVYVEEDFAQKGSYYFSYDLTLQNMVGETEQRIYGNSVSVALNDETFAAIQNSIALSGLIGNQYWVENLILENAQELNAQAVQEEYEAMQ